MERGLEPPTYGPRPLRPREDRSLPAISTRAACHLLLGHSASPRSTSRTCRQPSIAQGGPHRMLTPERAGTVEIEFASGGRMRISGSVDAATVSALIRALAQGKRRR